MGLYKRLGPLGVPVRRVIDFVVHVRPRGLVMPEVVNAVFRRPAAVVRRTVVEAVVVVFGPRQIARMGVKAAVDREWEKLEIKNAWLIKTVQPRAKVIEQAKNNNKQVKKSSTHFVS